MAEKYYQPAFFKELPIMVNEEYWVAHLSGAWGQLKAIAGQRKKLDEKEDDVRWLLGDWLVEGVDAGIKPKRLKKHVLEVTGLQQASKTLDNLMRVSRAVKTPLRRVKLCWSMHEAVAKFDAETQVKLLDEAEHGREEKLLWNAERGMKWPTDVRYSVRGFRKYIAKAQEFGQIPRVGEASAAKPNAEPKYQTISLRLSLANGNYLEDLADATNATSVEDMILTLLRRCITENKEEFQGEIAKYNRMFPDPKTRRYGRPLPAQRPRRRM
jgi:hypothetical protein